MTVDLVLAGVSSEAVENVVHKILGVGDEYFFILRLAHPKIFKCRQVAHKEIKRMQRNEEDGYFDGKFENIYDQFHVFTFKKTRRASEAVLTDLRIAIDPQETDDILPPTSIITVHIKVDIVCVPRDVIEEERQEGRLEGKQEVFKQLENYMGEPDIKKIKLQCEVANPPITKNPNPPPSITDAYEIATTNNIVSQICTQARGLGLQVYSNRSIIIDTEILTKCSKYASSQPDVTIYPSLFTILTTPVHQKVEDSLQSITNKVSGITLSGEGKKRIESKDPLGQLLVGMDKTFADLFVSKLAEKEFLSKLTIYGVYFVAVADHCTVVRADIDMGNPTNVYRGKQPLCINDAFNRILRYLNN